MKALLRMRHMNRRGLTGEIHQLPEEQQVTATKLLWYNNRLPASLFGKPRQPTIRIIPH
jgi:hypothetical protein